MLTARWRHGASFLAAKNGHYHHSQCTGRLNKPTSLREPLTPAVFPGKKWHLSGSLLTSGSPMWPPGNYWGASRGILEGRDRLPLSLIGHRERIFDVSCQLSRADWSKENLSRTGQCPPPGAEPRGQRWLVQLSGDVCADWVTWGWWKGLLAETETDFIITRQVQSKAL